MVAQQAVFWETPASLSVVAFSLFLRYEWWHACGWGFGGVHSVVTSQSTSSPWDCTSETWKGEHLYGIINMFEIHLPNFKVMNRYNFYFFTTWNIVLISLLSRVRIFWTHLDGCIICLGVFVILYWACFIHVLFFPSLTTISCPSDTVFICIVV